MGKVPNELREIIARNIHYCRSRKFPGRGGRKKCAETFGVSPQQWSPWERGMRTPDEMRLAQIAEFFEVTVEYLRRDNQTQQQRQEAEHAWQPPPGAPGDDFYSFMHPHAAASADAANAATTPSDAAKSTVYIPVFVFLPYLPESMKGLYDQFNAALNGGQTPDTPSA